ncbi:MAG: hypothetical protein KDD84_07910 [Caldilineaceae bacterium]|nr:hypothetical protein [Caldilineaceae bacterium]
MSEQLRMWVEISFNIAYLLVVWGLVIAMWRRRAEIAPSQRWAMPFIAAFALLALGDTGHVGFRIIAYALGDLDATFSLGGLQLGWVGLGALSTAVTLTFFYALIYLIWLRRFDRRLDWFGAVLLAAGVARLVIMAFPQNQWNSAVPPQPWSLYRNLPLIVSGLGVAYLILRDAAAAKDRTFLWIGAMILVSYAFYMPVIFWVQQMPMIGMLMIPKTLAYVAIAWIGYRHLFGARKTTASTLAHA